MTDLVQRLRKTHREIVDSDGGECELMADYREAADRIKALEEHVELLSRTSRTRYDELMVLKHRVSVLEMALREIRDSTSAPDIFSLCHEIARRALEGK